MLQIGSLAFAAPWVLAALSLLPVLWWLLRVTPPAPRRVRFPAVRLLFGLKPPEETAARTPWWLLLLRLLLAALVIIALARPLLNPAAGLVGNDPLLLVVDDGWSAARQWNKQRDAAETVLEKAERQGRTVRLLTTAPQADGTPPAVTGLMRAAEARSRLQALEPKPWPSDREAAATALDALPAGETLQAVWLSDGVEREGTTAFAERLQHLGSLTVHAGPPSTLPRLVLPPQSDGADLTARIVRAAEAGPDTLWLRGSGEDGRLLARERVAFEAGQTSAAVTLRLPSELRNRLTRLEIEGEPSAGAVVLLDERWRRRPVGLVAGGRAGEGQPLLGELYYVERALAPFTDLHRGSPDELLGQRQLAILVLADVGRLTEHEASVVGGWVDKGGVLLRFAGPRVAENLTDAPDPLLPVTLRGGGRTLGGAMSWSRPAALAPFAAESPFRGLNVPADVRINRQVLAEPALDLPTKTWARLDDGTPLVTAEKRGQGLIILVHTTANTDWSNLPLSGLFVEMLRRIVDRSQGVAAKDGEAPLPPLSLLDGFGRLEAPTAHATALTAAAFAEARPSPRHPPGFYGSEAARRALNLTASVDRVAALGPLPPGVTRLDYAGGREINLKPWLLAAALALLALDLLIALGLRGLLRRRTAGAAAAGLAALILLVPAPPARAQTEEPEQRAMSAALETRLAFVETGDPSVDDVSRSGLVGLSESINRRTAAALSEPMGVDVEQDELSFFPLLYWPVSESQATLSDAAVEKVERYLRTGGMILFDTRDAGLTLGTGGGPSADLQRIVGRIDLPPLTPLPTDHVLTRSFYLLSDLPGRWTGGRVWVEQQEGRVNDGVSSVILGSNDWAAAWAVDPAGRPMFAVTPGGEGQREMATRVGINLVMYVLTGNYKEDQVHVPAILERLGQ